MDLDFVLGITGGIGSGKTTLLDILKQDYGATLFIADQVGHEVFDSDSESFSRIVSHFGSVILDKDGNVRRDELARIIFQDESEKEFLDSIVHPYVIHRIQDEIVSWRSCVQTGSPVSEQGGSVRLFVLETALMFETGCDSLCNEVWGVTASVPIRIRRLIDNRGYSSDKASAIIASQVSDDFLIRHCDHIIENNGGLNDLKEALKPELDRFLCSADTATGKR